MVAMNVKAPQVVKMEENRVWTEVEAIARQLLRDPTPRGSILRATITSPGSDAFYEARLKRIAARKNRPAAIVVALERRPAVFDESVEMLRERYELTRREAVVAALLVDRLSNREIAIALDVTEHTARRHTEKVLMKLGVRRRSMVPEAVRAAMRPRRRAASARPAAPRGDSVAPELEAAARQAA